MNGLRAPGTRLIAVADVTDNHASSGVLTRPGYFKGLYRTELRRITATSCCLEWSDKEERESRAELCALGSHMSGRRDGRHEKRIATGEKRHISYELGISLADCLGRSSPSMGSSVLYRIHCSM